MILIIIFITVSFGSPLYLHNITAGNVPVITAPVSSQLTAAPLLLSGVYSVYSTVQYSVQCTHRQRLHLHQTAADTETGRGNAGQCNYALVTLLPCSTSLWRVTVLWSRCSYTVVTRAGNETLRSFSIIDHGEGAY